MPRNVGKAAPEGADAPKRRIGKKSRISLAASRRMAAAACDVLEVRADYWQLSRLDLSSFFDPDTAILVYEAMTDARREWERHFASRIRAKQSAALRNRRSHSGSKNRSATLPIVQPRLGAELADVVEDIRRCSPRAVLKTARQNQKIKRGRQ
jgi:hypothetical protein